MSKYIEVEKLIAEINDRLMSVNLEELGNFGCHRVWAYNDVKDLIASLQQEKPEADIEKEIDELWKSLNTGHDYVIVDSYQDFLGICLHCFELGLNARKDE